MRYPKHHLRIIVFSVIGLVVSGRVVGAEAYTSQFDKDLTLRCDRAMRKTFESLQSWRRVHGGNYPDRLADLASAGLIPRDGAICPEVVREAATADPAHRLMTSRREGGDPEGLYEYEMSDKVDNWKGGVRWLPTNSQPYTRKELKSELLRRQFFEQVPILRCSSHRASAPVEFKSERIVFRNLTVEGETYWSGAYWELNWLADVPYCCREANVLFGLKGPPFHTVRAPALPGALDLRPWSCAFGDHPWWWNFPLFDEKPNLQTAPDLKPFYEERHGRVMDLVGTKWWLDGVVQLQGRINPEERTMYQEPCILAFVRAREGLPIGRTFHKASWIQGTLWSAPAGATTGWLVWYYTDGGVERVPLIYGKTTARFWGDLDQVESEKGFPEPMWRHHQTAADVGKERWLRLYQQDWINPRPNVQVTSVDFVSNTNSPAAPFLIAVNLSP